MLALSRNHGPGLSFRITDLHKGVLYQLDLFHRFSRYGSDWLASSKEAVYQSHLKINDASHLVMMTGELPGSEARLIYYYASLIVEAN